MSKRGGCCDACGITGRNERDDIVCRECRLLQQAADARRKGWDRQYHMIQGMLAEERARWKEAR